MALARFSAGTFALTTLFLSIGKNERECLMRRPAGIALLLFGVLVFSARAQEPRLDALKKFILEKDYSEVFGTDEYKTRIENVLDVDVDNDGVKELVVLYFPH